MAATVSLQEIRAYPDGRRTVHWADGFVQEFASLDALIDWCHHADSGASGVENTKQICVGYAQARDEDLSDYQSVRGKSFSFDLTSPSPIKVQ